jgi:hypothetical protein
MVKILNAVFGIGIAVIIFIVALLGIKTFYPEPQYGTYCNDSIFSTPAYPIISIYDCPQNITVNECINFMSSKGADPLTQAARDKESVICSDSFNNATKSYNKTFFIIASALGLIAIIVAFFLLSIMSLSAGTAFAGIVLIVVAFVRGWNDSNDTLKFAIGLVIAVVVIFLALKINKKFSNEQEDSKSVKHSKEIPTNKARRKK